MWPCGRKGAIALQTQTQQKRQGDDSFRTGKGKEKTVFVIKLSLIHRPKLPIKYFEMTLQWGLNVPGEQAMGFVDCRITRPDSSPGVLIESRFTAVQQCIWNISDCRWWNSFKMNKQMDPYRGVMHHLRCEGCWEDVETKHGEMHPQQLYSWIFYYSTFGQNFVFSVCWMIHEALS